MKYVITGSLGHISQPIVKALTAAGHHVTVISSQQERARDVQALGATAAIGSLTDRQFIQDTFKDADAVYLMIPPNYMVQDFPAYQREVAGNYVAALKQSNVQRIVLLSSIGAHLRAGAGPIDELGNLEEQLKSLIDKNVTILRPAFFYYNLLGMAALLKNAGIVGSNFGSDTEKMAMVHHLDIADRAIDALLHPSADKYSIEYIASDEQYTADVARILGTSVGRENVSWVSFSDEQSYQAMTQQGLTPSLANEYVEMGKGFREGIVQEDYWKHRMPLTSQRNLESFATEFAQVYQSVPELAAHA